MSIVKKILLILIAGLLGVLPLLTATSNIPAVMAAPEQSTGISAVQQATNNFVFLPAVKRNAPPISPFGFQSNGGFTAYPTILNHANNLHMRWARAPQISWRRIQPVEGGPIDWNSLAAMEQQLRMMKSYGFTPVVIIWDSPHWAVIPDARDDNQLTSCAPIQPEKLPVFAELMRQLVERYSTSEFNVHNWEIGNEPDVDPDLVTPDNLFGCWGDRDDTNGYGGWRYGEMLKVVTPAIRSADPSAKVWLGGLLLNSPNSNPGEGKPENFLRGVLNVGAGDYFDVLPFHWYPSYGDARIDYDLSTGFPWGAPEWGGGTTGKTRFLRNILSEYGLSKPIFLNETGLGCPNDGLTTYPYCVPQPAPAFFQSQADHIVRSFTRGLHEGIAGFMWYTLEGPGWRETGLLDKDGNPRPSYYAYQQLALRLNNSQSIAERPNYGVGTEAYTFIRNGQVTQVIWTVLDVSATISTPQAGFIKAIDLWGAEITPVASGSNYQLPISFSPIYLIRNP